MFMDAEVEDFLEHFGVKGQKWGIRKSRGPGGEKARAERFSPRQKKVLVVAGSTALAAGSAFVGASLARRGMVDLNTANRFADIKASRTLIEYGHRFTQSRMESEILLNNARQVRDGLGAYDWWKLT